MSLDGAQRRRYARQLLLGEVGERGQERLLAACFRPGADCDRAAYAVASDYLERAGLAPHPTGLEVRVVDADTIEGLAGSPALREAAAWIAGSFAAVEHLKAVLGIAAARDLPSDLRLSGEA